MPRKIILLLVLALSTGLVSAQTTPDKNKSEEKEQLRKAAVEFLRETMAEVNAMRSLENRLSFGAELASLMWYHDEKEAKAMYQGVTADFRRLLFELDNQLNQIKAAEENDEGETGDASPVGFIFGGGGEKAVVERKMQKALEMRQSIAISLAENEPDLALSFYYDSITAVTNKDFQGRAADRDQNFEMQLMSQVAETNAAKAAQFGTRSLDKGFNYQHLELLKKIYAKDPEKAIEFAGAVVSRYRSSKMEGSDTWVLHSLIEWAETTGPTAAKADQKPALEKSQLRELTEILAQAVLAADAESVSEDLGGMYMATFEKYTPARAAQIKAKFRNRPVTSGNPNATVNAVANVATTAAVASNAPANVAAPVPDVVLERKAKAIEERLEAERKLMEQVGTMADKKLPAEERNKIVEQARKVIARSGGKDKKILALSMLASQVAKAGDKELAADIMKDAEALTNPQPKNYQDYLLNWMLITGYAQVDAEKAFPKLTDTIFRLNGTIEAFVKAAEFIDARAEIIDDGEVQVGQFGGSMLRGITKELTIAEPTLRNLTRADFAKTRAAVNTFDRTEVRVLAKMLIIRAVLSEKDGEKDKDMFEMFNESK